MISAKQAREKQLTINWRDNYEAAKVYKKGKKRALKEIEEEINAALAEGNNLVYFTFTNDLYGLKLVTSEAEYRLAHADFAKDIEEELKKLGYRIKIEYSTISSKKWWKISW